LIGVIAHQSAVRQAKPAASVDVKLTLGQPIQVGPITIVPIESKAPLARDEYLTLAEASTLGVVEIVEIPGQEEVNSLEVRNHAKLPILLFAGELLLGGKQDRIVAKDSIVPGMQQRNVPVFCVEHGRWDGKPVFQSGDTLVSSRVRNVTLSSASQVQVWDSVAASNKAVAAAPATGTFQGTLNAPKTKAVSTKLFAALSAKFATTPRTVGVICCIGGKIESADIFANADLFRHSESKLFHSYALDASLATDAKSIPADRKACETFLRQIVSARRENTARSKDGVSFAVHAGAMEGFESGRASFKGGVGGGAGFGHGTYIPNQAKGGGN